MGHMLTHYDFKSLNANEKNRWVKFSVQVCYISDVTELYILSNEPVPENIVNRIASDSKSSYDYAKLLLRYDKPVPENIVNRIASDIGISREYAELLIQWNKPVPEIIKAASIKP